MSDNAASGADMATSKGPGVIVGLAHVRRMII